MLNCSGDPLENYLKPFGYSVVLLPRTGVRPLQLAVLKAGRRMETVGDLAAIFAANTVALPAVTSETALDLSGARSGSLNIGVGLKLLSGALAAIGIPPLGLKAGFDKASKISFQFADVTIEATAFADLDRFLADASLIGNSPSIKAMLDADTIHAITGVLCARTIIVNAEDSKGGEVAIDVPDIVKTVIGADASAKAASGSSSRLELTSPVPLAFGIKAVRLFFDGGALTTMKPVEAGGVALESRSLFAPNPDPVLLDAVV